MLAAKFGFGEFGTAQEDIAQEGLTLLQSVEGDYTLFFRALTDAPPSVPDDDAAAVALLGDIFYNEDKQTEFAPALAAWLRRWCAARVASGADRAATQELMGRANPRFVLRNYLAQQAIDAATDGDPTLVHELLDTMRRPYDAQPGREAFAAKRPDWARHKAGCSMLSCSS
jgi:serine/tyrosine/threonine adenylyltransferase